MVLKLETSQMKDWKGYKGRPFLISGPCSAETEEQVMDTARELAQINEVSHFPGRHMETKDQTKLL